MRQLKNSLCKLLYSFGVHYLLDRILGPNRLTVLLYHRVTTLDDPLVGHRALISATPDSFELQMNYISKQFNAISMFDLGEFLLHDKTLPPRPLLITFDDGYADNYENARPILERYGLPATFFLTTDFIGNPIIPWWDECAWYFSHTEKQSEDIPLIGRRHLVSTRERSHACRDFLQALKCTHITDWPNIIEQLRQSLGVSKVSPTIGRFMSWDDARALIESDILCQPHSTTHPILSQVTAQRAYDEINGSVSRIRQECDIPAISFAYPNGNCDSSIISLLKQEDVEMAFTTESALLKLSELESNRYVIPRIPINSSDSFPTFVLKLVGIVMFLEVLQPFRRVTNNAY